VRHPAALQNPQRKSNAEAQRALRYAKKTRSWW
jgi:hypothetical protein